MKPTIEHRIQDCLFIFFISFALKLSTALVINPFSADGCLYLNIARNLARGIGFYCSYNLYQYWGPQEVFYPALVFMHPLFPLLAGIVWFFFHSLAAVNVVNVCFSGINCLILYLIVERMYNSRVAFLSAVLASVCWPMFLTATLPWSEQLHLFFVLGAIWCMTDESFPQKGLNIFLAGLALGLSCLVRVSGFYNLFIFSGVLIAFFGFSKKTAKILFLFLFAFFIIVVPYEIFCYMKYHIFYPEYPNCARVFINARATAGGRYLFTKPVLRLPHDFKFNFFNLFFYNFPRHLLAFATAIFGDLNFLSWILPVKFFYILRKRRFDENLLLWIGLGNILLFSFAFYWLPTEGLETHRYLLVPLVFWIPLGVAAFYDVPRLLKVEVRKSHENFYFLVLSALLLYMIGYGAIRANNFTLSHLREARNVKITQKSIFRWVMEHSTPSEIIATSEYQVAFDLDRPIVSLPEGKTINDSNMINFLKIYHPKYVLIGKSSLNLYKKYLDKYCQQEQLPQWLSQYYLVYKLRIMPNRDQTP